LYFLSRFMRPLDVETVAALDDVFRAGKNLVDYTRNAISNPTDVANDVAGDLRRFRVKVDPTASRPADTLWGEAARNFNVGLNGGEALFDLASLLGGAAEVKALAKLGKVAKVAGPAKYVARGYPGRVANYFAEPYDGLGHHFVPRRTKLPAFMGGGPVPSVISDSPFFLLKPRNMSKGDFFERHFQVDPHYYGGKIRADFGGGGWSGRKLGWEKRGLPGRIWYGSPLPLKAVAGAGMFGAGGVVDQIWNEDGQP
jgi:hypothetical protein